MNRPAPRGGFSALRAAAPLIQASNDRRQGLKLIGAAVCRLVYQETGLVLSDAPCGPDTAAEIGKITQSLRDLFGIPMGTDYSRWEPIGADDGSRLEPMMGADDGSRLEPMMGADDGNPQTPEGKGKKEGKIPSFLHQTDNGKKEGMGFSSIPSFEEWAEQSKAIGWDDPIAVREAYDWRAEQGWADVKSWKRLCSCLANNWKTKTRTGDRFAAAFATPKMGGAQ